MGNNAVNLFGKPSFMGKHMMRFETCNLWFAINGFVA